MNYIPPVDTLGYQDEQRRIIKEATTNKGITLIVGAVNSWVNPPPRPQS